MYVQYRPAKFNKLPPVVKNLFLINGLFFLAKYVIMARYHYDITQLFGLHYPGGEFFKPWQFITYQFMHANLRHILFNMVALYLFGYMLENLWGSRRFLIFYLVTGMGAALIHFLWVWFSIRPEMNAIDAFLQHPSNTGMLGLIDRFNFPYYSHNPFDFSHATAASYAQVIGSYKASLGNGLDNAALQSAITFVQNYRYEVMNAPTMTIVGASGSLFGVLAGVGMLFPNTSFPYFFGLPIKWIVILWGAAELYSAFKSGSDDLVAHAAHLGGLLFGFILVKIYQRDRTRFY